MISEAKGLLQFMHSCLTIVMFKDTTNYRTLLEMLYWDFQSIQRNAFEISSPPITRRFWQCGSDVLETPKDNGIAGASTTWRAHHHNGRISLHCIASQSLALLIHKLRCQSISRMFFHVQPDEEEEEEEEEGCTLGMLFHIEPDDEEEEGCSLGQQEDKRKITQNNICDDDAAASINIIKCLKKYSGLETVCVYMQTGAFHSLKSRNCNYRNKQRDLPTNSWRVQPLSLSLSLSLASLRLCNFNKY